MLCRMPVVRLPDDLIQDLEKRKFGQIDNAQGSGVASYVNRDGSIRADIYIGLQLDGVRLYRNMSLSHPALKMQFALKPIVMCQNNVIAFNPFETDTIAVKVVATIFDYIAYSNIAAVAIC